MKKIAIATLIASAFATSAMATEVSVEFADVTSSVATIALEDVVLPVAGLDLDIETTRGNANSADDSMLLGLDYVVKTPFDVATVAGVELNSENNDLLVELDNTYTTVAFTNFVELDYTFVDGKDKGSYEIGTDYKYSATTTFGVQYENGFTTEGKTGGVGEVSVTQQLDAKMFVEVTQAHNFNTSYDTTEVEVTYNFSPAVYAEATYTFHEVDADNVAGIKVGYKF